MNNPIKTGIASFGMSGIVFHAPLLFSNPHFELSAIVERSRENSKERFGLSKILRSFEELLESKEIELVVINTPDYLHYEQTRMALEAGKHVIVEKPFTQKYEEAVTLIELAKKKNRVLTVFQNRRWDGDFMTVQKILKGNMLGRLVSFESHFDRFRNYIQENTWKEQPSSGTGIVFNLGSHLIDQAIVLFGKPKYVNADIRTLRTDGKIDDYFDIRLEYQDNLSVAVCGSLLVKEAGPRFILHGLNGSFLKWGTDPQEQDLKDGKIPMGSNWGKSPESTWGKLNVIDKGKKQKTEIETLPGNYQLFYDALYKTIREGAEVPVKAEDAALGVKIINAAFQSMNEKRWVEIS